MPRIILVPAHAVAIRPDRYRFLPSSVFCLRFNHKTNFLILFSNILFLPDQAWAQFFDAASSVPADELMAELVSVLQGHVLPKVLTTGDFPPDGQPQPYETLLRDVVLNVAR